jgi:hypothetical protein
MISVQVPNYYQYIGLAGGPDSGRVSVNRSKRGPKCYERRLSPLNPSQSVAPLQTSVGGSTSVWTLTNGEGARWGVGPRVRGRTRWSCHHCGEPPPLMYNPFTRARTVY